MLKILTELDGVSGNEKEVSDFIISQVAKLSDETIVDTMGNLICFKKGKLNTGKKIAVFAHMDEVGLIVKEITDDGYLKFDHVGGIDDRILLTQKVKIGRKKIEGVIGVKAVHLQSSDERKKVIRNEQMYIDIGASSKAEAEKYVSKGDYISFKSEYVRLYNRRFKAKAIDDRIGCEILMELMKDRYDSDVYFCFTVQEEVGLRGAKVLSRRIEPNIAFVLEATTASDTAYTPEHLYGTVLGNGPVLTMMDRGAYADKELSTFVANIANERGIKFQYKLTSNGGNDSRAIQTESSGCKVCSISLPCRYIHSPNSVADGSDCDNMKKLIRAVLNEVHTFKTDNDCERNE